MSASVLLVIGCPRCAAPIDPLAAGCESCDSPLELDAAIRHRLDGYRFRLRRDLHHLRALVTPKIAEAMLPPTYLWWSTGLFLGFVGLFIAVPIVIVAVGIALMREMVLLVVFAALASDVALLILGPWALMRWGRRWAARVRGRARESLANLDLVHPERCGACGGMVPVVAIVDGEALVCPWCTAAQVPAPGFAAKTDETLRRALAVARVENAHVARRAKPTAPPVGFVAEPGGTVVRGTVSGVEVVAFNEIVGDRCIQRLEMSTPTVLAGECWWIEQNAEPVFRAFLAEWGERLPEESNAPTGWRRFGSADHPTAAEIAGVLVQRLEPGTGFVIDAGGVSLWRSVSLLTPAWRLVSRHGELAAWAARALGG